MGRRAVRPCLPLAAGFVLFVQGCHGYLRPFDESPLPARATWTRGGDWMKVRDGQVYLLSSPEDVGTALGVSLSEGAQGVLVEERLDPGVDLRPEDHIVHVAPVLPPVPAPKSAAGTARAEETTQAAYDPQKVPVPPDLASLRALPPGHPVRSLSDLSGYLAGTGWLLLDLGIIREGKDLVVRAKVAERYRPLATKRWDPRFVFRKNGIEACLLSDWNPDDRPKTAEAGDLLILRVATGSEAAFAGLRPLDLVTDPGSFERSGRALVRSGDGSLKRLRIAARRERTVWLTMDIVTVWVPFLFSWESDGARSHLGIGPLDLLFHFSSRRDYNWHTDSFEIRRRWSLLGTVQQQVVLRPSGDWRTFSLDPLFDMTRFDYGNDLLLARDPYPSWSGPEEIEDLLGAE